MRNAFVGHPVIFNRGYSSLTWDSLVLRMKREFVDEVITIFPDSRVMEDSTPKLVHDEIKRVLKDSRYDPHEDYFLAAGDMTIYGAMLLVSADHWGVTPKQLRHIRSTNSYEVLPLIDYNVAAHP